MHKYRIGLWGKCKSYLRPDGEMASPHNHMLCNCPACEPTTKWWMCVMTGEWLSEAEIIKTQEMGGGG